MCLFRATSNPFQSSMTDSGRITAHPRNRARNLLRAGHSVKITFTGNLQAGQVTEIAWVSLDPLREFNAECVLNHCQSRSSREFQGQCNTDFLTRLGTKLNSRESPERRTPCPAHEKARQPRLTGFFQIRAKDQLSLRASSAAASAISAGRASSPLLTAFFCSAIRASSRASAST